MTDVPEVVQGFPAFLGVQGQGTLSLPKVTLVNRQGAIQVNLRSPEGGRPYHLTSFNNTASTGTAIDYQHRLADAGSLGRPQTSIVLARAARQGEIVFDLSALILKSNLVFNLSALPLGRYSIDVQTTDEPVVISPSVEMSIVEATPVEKIYLAQLQNRWTQKYQDFLGQDAQFQPVNLERRFDWGNYLFDPFPLPNPAGLRPSQSKSVAVYQLLGDIVSQPDPLHHYPIQDLEAAQLPKCFEPMKNVLRYELLRTQNPAEAAMLGEQLKTIQPLWSWAMQDVEHNRGLIAALLRNRNPQLNRVK